jgi:hypothetical protein
MGDWTSLAIEQIGKKHASKFLQCFFQNGLAFLRQIGKAGLSKFPDIYEGVFLKFAK